MKNTGIHVVLDAYTVSDRFQNVVALTQLAHIQDSGLSEEATKKLLEIEASAAKLTSAGRRDEGILKQS